MTHFFPVFAEECREVRVQHLGVKQAAPITSVQCHGTFGSLTFRVGGDKLVPVVRLPLWLGAGRGCHLGVTMKFIYVCYAALGFAVARWVFKREPMPAADPVSRLRTSGLL